MAQLLEEDKEESDDDQGTADDKLDEDKSGEGESDDGDGDSDIDDEEFEDEMNDENSEDESGEENADDNVDDDDEEDGGKNGHDDIDIAMADVPLLAVEPLSADEPLLEDESEGKAIPPPTSRRRKVCLAIFCGSGFTVITMIILANILAARNDKVTVLARAPVTPPSAAPSIVPTDAPTLYPNQIVYPVIADTFLLSGNFSDTVFGGEDHLMVRGGDANSTDEAWILLEFDLTDLPPDGNKDRESQILLELSHIESLGETRDSIVVNRIPNGKEVDVESISFDDYLPVIDTPGPSFSVATGKETVQVDITELIRGTIYLRRGRRLQGSNRVFLQLVSEDGNTLGEVFRSREAGEDTAPKIIHNFVDPSPSASPSGSSAPSVSPAPSSASTDSVKTLVPSIESSDDRRSSTVPTTSVAPSSAPPGVIPI